MKREAERNAERFRITKWAEHALKNFRVHPPGTGILHTFNIEQLATAVIVPDEPNGLVHPETLIGTDSHTPMINGLGVLGWGIGGLEAEGVMFGIPVVMQIPDVVGVRLTGRLQPGVLATDLALRLTELLRAAKLDSAFAEFFGPEVSGRTVGDRAVVANMAPEYGAQTAYFPVDDASLDYLRQTGRPEQLISLVEEYYRRSGLWFDPAATPQFTRTIELDLSSVVTSIAGPKRPHDRLHPSEAPQAIKKLADRAAPDGFALGHGTVAIASITSCTNTTDPRLSIAAALLARNARRRGLKPAPWVKTAFSPGSPAASRYLQRAGLLDDLEALGFGIVGFGCMACIGNTGPLSPDMTKAISEGLLATAVISGNRNFPGRVHPLLENGFLASPPLVVAYAIAGTSATDITTESLGKDFSGKDVFLSDIWPSTEEIDDVARLAHDADDYGDAFRQAGASEQWRAVKAPTEARFPWDEGSSYLRRPPFTYRGQESRLGSYSAAPLLVLGDDVTTDHISPAGPIEAANETGRYLVRRGEDPLDLNVHSSRRGNYESLVRGLFTNKSVVNHLGQGIPAGSTLVSGHKGAIPVFEAADLYRRKGISTVVLAGERYGQGSSRDWAAKGLALLDVRAVLALSFERIHRTNLIGMGILPLAMPVGVRPAALGLRPEDRIEIRASVDDMRLGRVGVTILRGGETLIAFDTVPQVKTELEIGQLAAGGVVPLILARAKRARIDVEGADHGHGKF